MLINETCYCFQLYGRPWSYVFVTMQMFAGNCREFAGKSECRDFKFRGIACIPAISVIFKSPHSDFHYNICREFDFTGILWDIPCIARVMVRITLSGGVSNVSQLAGWNNF